MTTNRIIVVLYNLNPNKPNTYSSALVFQRQIPPSKEIISNYLQDKGISDTICLDSGKKVCNFKPLVFCDNEMGINMMLDCLSGNNFTLVCNESQELKTRIKQVLNQRSQDRLETLRHLNTDSRFLYMI